MPNTTERDTNSAESCIRFFTR